MTTAFASPFYLQLPAYQGGPNNATTTSSIQQVFQAVCDSSCYGGASGYITGWRTTGSFYQLHDGRLESVGTLSVSTHSNSTGFDSGSTWTVRTVFVKANGAWQIQRMETTRPFAFSDSNP